MDRGRPTPRAALNPKGRALGLAPLIVAGAGLLIEGCARPAVRDVGNTNPRSEFDGQGGGLGRDGGGVPADRVPAHPTVAGGTPRVLFRSSTRALALRGKHLYFGDEDDDVLLAGATTGGATERLARRAPIPGALVVAAENEEDDLVWIATPGDTILRIGHPGTSPITIRDRGLFTGVAISQGDVFFTEAEAGGGTLSRITGTTVAKIATFEGSPRGLVVDRAQVYVTTTKRIVAAPRNRGKTTTLATISGLSQPCADEAAIYATAYIPSTDLSRALVRVSKTGGPAETVTVGVREGPIAAHDGVVYWFDAARPMLLGARHGEPPRTIGESAAFEHPEALTVGSEAAYVATGHGEDAVILTVPIPAH